MTPQPTPLGSAASAVRITAVVPLKDKLPYVQRCLDSILDAAEAFGSAELIVVDNGSLDGSWELVSDRYASRCTLLQVPDVTISAVRNAGAVAAAGQILAFFDADCIVPLTYFADAEQVLHETGATAVGCKVGLPDSPTWVESVWHWLHSRQENGFRRWMNSANFTVWRGPFEQIGGFDENLVTGEDTELCQRLLASGGTIFEDQRLRVQHLDNAKTLRAFYRKEHWRALGMLGTVSRGAVDMPLIATSAHALMLLAAALSPLVLGPSLTSALLAALMVLAVPTVAVIYRQRQFGHSLFGLQAITLYGVYLTARVAALGSILLGKLRTDFRYGKPDTYK